MNGQRSLVFVVGNNTQFEAVAAVLPHLPERDVRVLNLWSMRSTDDDVLEPFFPGHTPPLTLSRAFFVLRSVNFSPGDIVVIPQDVGLLERLVAKRVKRDRAILVLMPDGIVGAGARSNGGRTRTAIRIALNGLLRLLGLVDGVPGRMGSSGPAVIFSWGPGWNTAFVRSASTRFLSVGSPRMDKYRPTTTSSARRRLLVCSQPMHVPTWSAPYADCWYSFLATLSSQANDDLEIAIRLHPAERNDSRVPVSLRANDSGEDLVSQIEWADCVAAPFSTVLIDALAAQKFFFVLAADDQFARSVADIPLFSDQRVPISFWNLESVKTAMRRSSSQEELRMDYLANAGHAAQAAARQLVELAESSRVVPQP